MCVSLKPYKSKKHPKDLQYGQFCVVVTEDNIKHIPKLIGSKVRCVYTTGFNGKFKRLSLQVYGCTLWAGADVGDYILLDLCDWEELKRPFWDLHITNKEHFERYYEFFE